MWIVKRLFHDKRCTVGLLLLWMVTVCSIFYALGAFHMGYMHVGTVSETSKAQLTCFSHATHAHARALLVAQARAKKPFSWA